MASILTLAIAHIPYLPVQKKHLLARKYVSSQDFAALHGTELIHEFPDLASTKSRQLAWSQWHGKQALIDAEKLLEQLQKRHIAIIDILDKTYPSLLKEIYDPPFLLYYRGRLPSTATPSLAIVGTRKPSLNAKEECALFTREVAPYVSSIVSGLALGIDGQAHRAALATGRHTTAILGGGFDHLYPSSHKNLAARIIDEGGLLLTEYAPSIAPKTYSFPERNRIIAGITNGTLIIEAPHRSGSLITGQLALDYGRDLFVHAVGITNTESGTSQLYEDGAIALKRGDDLLSLWGITPKRAQQSPTTIMSESTLNSQKPRFDSKLYNLGNQIAEELWREISDEDFNNLL
ncbi:DNA-processing protein DprA [Entomospira nematocerorum]|uniref:DNA-protecting protein DprA n=1 Tax=Entomospira nematocerorum TaxID=2719987 RepID=A0A968GFW0_9SPIO|nr:DNA-processing protein DprA [Entomospira nematocera]NIZ47503.1 DNA-protecting protein DprA [Entomospira nematocera]WDI33957.1 DNA-processing protein DprA [Entomospira nematocera]